jgi:hypothetical protein
MIPAARRPWTGRIGRAGWGAASGLRGGMRVISKRGLQESAPGSDCVMLAARQGLRPRHGPWRSGKGCVAPPVAAPGSRGEEDYA